MSDGRAQKNPAQGRVLSFLGSGGALCTLATAAQSFAVLEVPLIVT